MVHIQRQIDPMENLLVSYSFVNVLSNLLIKLVHYLELYPKGMAGFRRFRELIEQEPEIKDRPDAVAVAHLNGDIVFDDVHFHYDDNKAVLEGIDLNIRAGQTVAFVGPSVLVKQRFVH